MPSSAPHQRKRPGAAPLRRTRGSLTRDEILAAGLRIAREEDLGRLTMKRLGDELGVTAMALYRHFRNKSELIDGILDRFVHEAAVTAHGPDAMDWEAWLLRTCQAQYRALAETPGVLPFVAANSGWRFGPAALATIDETLGTLLAAGFDRDTAVEIQTTTLALAIGWATLDSGGVTADDPEGAEAGAEARRQLAHRFAGESRQARTNVVGAASELASAAASATLFEQSVAGYLAGVATRRNPSKRRAK